MEFILVILGVWLATFLLYALIDAIVIAIYILWSLSLAKIFDKIGEESWKAYVPGYNIFIILKAAGLPVYYMLACLLPIFGRLGWMAFYMFIIYISVMLAKKFRKQKHFLINIIIAPPLYFFEMGKDNSVYEGNYNKGKEEK